MSRSASILLRLIDEIRRRFGAGREGAPNWFPLALGGLVVAAGLLFIHLFMALLLLTIAVCLGIVVAEKILGPGTRISLRLPTGVKLRLKRWLGIGTIR